MTTDFPFERSIRWQIEINQARTPTERFNALCDLLDAARAMAPNDAQARARRARVLAARQKEKEEWRAQCRHLFAAGRSDAATGV